ncbi:ASPIC/UnbV domain-containing protein [Lentilitoribacter sp. Alg239-R112]|uniref:ASPIC/UnbV domain-containing protein n=1 Tax=Lentilitoribacter sp. Alg239-R112 TaxID=2305987 RepID=UPI0013A69BBD|nr:ASPIC/UnbV domain-containing protein [Lentilitoribacter sp. Alg239-R112]
MRKYIISFTAALLLTSSPTFAETDFPFDVPSMNEQSATAGIKHQYDGPWEYFVGGGGASFDCNGDRMPDLFLAGGTNDAQLFINRSKPEGNLNFEKQALDLGKSLTKVVGAYPLNIDNDEHMDVVILRVGSNQILQGGPDCSFTKYNNRLSFNGGREWSTGFAAIWEGKNDFPTLAFGNYVDRSAPGSPWGTCSPNILLRPDGTGKYGEQISLEPGFCSLSMIFTDWNKSNKPDLRITNDRQYYRGGEEQLWNISDGQMPKIYGRSDGWETLKIWGMGIAEADLDGDGFPEYALTSMGDTKIQSLDQEADEESPIYRDIAYDLGATAHRPYIGDDLKPSTGWHSQFADFNNDARRDLFIAKGNVEAMPDFAKFDPDNMLLGGLNGVFTEKGDEAGIALDTVGRGAIIEDFNADGMLDLVVINRKSNISLFLNEGAKTEWGHRPMGNWVKIELDNGDINPSAVGAKISVKTGNLNQSKTIQIGGGHASGQAGFSHFGLGVAERATIRVQWPNGDWSHPYKVFANNHVVIKRGNDAANYWYPVTSE